jgi:hypothetical protein
MEKITRFTADCIQNIKLEKLKSAETDVTDRLLAMIREFTCELADQQFCRILKLSLWRGGNTYDSQRMHSVWQKITCSEHYTQQPINSN